jgi:plastocyanin
MKKITALLAVAALGLAACGSSDDNSSSAAASGTSSSSSSSSGGGGYGSGGSKTTSSSASTSSGSGETKVNLVDNAFQPKTITGKAGSTVKVELKNTGNAEHNFSVDSQKVSKDVEAGEDATVSVKIPASGSVQFYCEYHKGLGMTGTLKAS